MYRILFILGTLIAVECQVCTKTVRSSQWVPQTNIKTYKESYRTRCWYGSCKKTRIASYQDRTLVQKVVVATIKTCCYGYVDNGEEANSIQCEPVCIPTCTNGYCHKPGECKCNDGYFLEPHSTFKCQPSCKTDCGRGHCSAPETCTCDFGYQVFENNTSCQPICMEPCINGTCIAPETCECNIGYRKSDNNTCAPYCSKGCTHGTCVSPEVCQCDAGFKKSEDQCVPHCESDCGYGNCTAPNECTCNEGYKIENSTCVPHCNTTCDNGKCIAPNTCECEEGFSNEFGVCQPVCSISCENGHCIAPDDCQCNIDYVKSENGSCTPICIECDHGRCVAPGICECYEGWINNSTNCIPSCKTPCGHGSCVQPNVCECYPGYKQDPMAIGSEICVPDCDVCKNMCMEPECICDYPCCTSMDCIKMYRTEETTTEEDSTTIESIGYANTGIYEEYSATYDDDTSSENTLTTDNEELAKDDNAGFPYWVYYLLLGLIIISPFSVYIIIFASRRQMQRYLKGGSYEIDDRYPQCKDFAISQAMSGSLSSNISYSDIKNRRENIHHI